MKEITKLQMKKVQDILHYALKKKVINKTKFCEYCHFPCKTEGHHENYNFPLQVVWLCHSCHQQYHSDKLKGVKDDITELYYRKYK